MRAWLMNSLYLYLLIAALLISSGVGYSARPLEKIARTLRDWHADYRRVHHLDDDEKLDEGADSN
jgi:hypothetical protein